MAISLFTPTYSFKYSSNLPHRPSIPNPSCSFRLRAVPESSSKRSPTTPSQDPETLCRDDKVESLPTSSGSDSFSRLRKLLKVDGLVLEILSIALPAALALAADPLTSLVDTAFVGHLGAVELAAVGVSVSVFNLVSKLFNVPLLNITTSFVAEEQALVAKEVGDNQINSDHVAGCQNKIILPSVSTSLALAAGLGIAEAVALFFGSGFLMTSMGITDDSPIRVPAEQFLILRAFGAPPIVIAQAAQGTFRGFKDTKTPLYAVDCTLATCHSSGKI